jgi:hypothetical protein
MDVKCEERELRMSEKRMPRIFGPKRNEVTEHWRKLHNEELLNLYSLQNVITIVKSKRTCQREENHIQNFGRKT